MQFREEGLVEPFIRVFRIDPASDLDIFCRAWMWEEAMSCAVRQGELTISGSDDNLLFVQDQAELALKDEGRLVLPRVDVPARLKFDKAVGRGERMLTREVLTCRPSRSDSR